MVTAERREQVRTRILERARDDVRIAGAAVTGSAAHDAEDSWSDVDLFFGVASDTTVDEAISDWTAFVYDEFGAIHHFDVTSSSATYRAFLLPDLLEVDLGFTPAARFGPLGNGGFRVVFGAAAPRQASTPDAGHRIGLAWHHVLHARISIERGAWWQAEYWISDVRNLVLELACLRSGHPTAYAKGAHLLPAEMTDPLQDTLVRGLDPAELTRALASVTRLLVSELHHTDPGLAATLEKPLLECVTWPGGSE